MSYLTEALHARVSCSTLWVEQVYKALHDDVRFVAVKLLHTDGTGDAMQTQLFWREIEQLAECRDAHLLQFYGQLHVQSWPSA